MVWTGKEGMKEVRFVDWYEVGGRRRLMPTTYLLMRDRFILKLVQFGRRATEQRDGEKRLDFSPPPTPSLMIPFPRLLYDTVEDQRWLRSYMNQAGSSSFSNETGKKPIYLPDLKATHSARLEVGRPTLRGTSGDDGPNGEGSGV